MIGSVIVRTLVASTMTLFLVATAAVGVIDAGDLVSAAVAGMLWWTLLTDWMEARRNRLDLRRVSTK